MAISTKPWSGDASNYPDAKSFCNACLLDLNPDGQDPSKSNCKLPVREPSGDVNANAVHAASAALAGARGGLRGVSPSDKKAAAKKLLGYYRQMKEDPPDSLKNMAR